MNKSEIYRKAQLCVIESDRLLPETKLEIIQLLMSDESTAAWSESYEAKKKECADSV